ncbi:hypothetical protein LTR36_005224 [Oleoguttula mirabilis]|uniref:Dynein light chain n=1 Tax=Oleoguttula mirabilis TaxID=1507867 RepID=A0AAV9JW46_9PEZI|nr:hypothetical protein LTR36_005224 [Oleoguttula mirabilis]
MIQPISTTRLRQISNDACDSALATAAAYEHSATQRWNSEIINAILKSLISESTSDTSPTKYKFCVNSTIIQHLADPRPAGSGSSAAATQTDAPTGEAAEEGAAEEEAVTMGGEEHKKVGRRGMHSASGAYWNNEKDGMWSHKYECGEGKGMDIVISVMWIAV